MRTVPACKNNGTFSPRRWTDLNRQSSFHLPDLVNSSIAINCTHHSQKLSSVAHKGDCGTLGRGHFGAAGNAEVSCCGTDTSCLTKGLFGSQDKSPPPWSEIRSRERGACLCHRTLLKLNESCWYAGKFMGGQKTPNRIQILFFPHFSTPWMAAVKQHERVRATNTRFKESKNEWLIFLIKPFGTCLSHHKSGSERESFCDVFFQSICWIPYHIWGHHTAGWSAAGRVVASREDLPRIYFSFKDIKVLCVCVWVFGTDIGNPQCVLYQISHVSLCITCHEDQCFAGKPLVLLLWTNTITMIHVCTTARGTNSARHKILCCMFLSVGGSLMFIWQSCCLAVEK